VKLWDAHTGREALTLRGHTDAVTGVAYSPDGTRLASASWDRTVRVWDVGSGQAVLTLEGHTDALTGVAWSPGGTRLASASEDQTVRVWDARSGRELLTLKGHAGPVRGVAFSPDGTRLATASDDETVKLWDADSSAEVLTLKGHTSPVESVAWSPDGTRLATASVDQTVRVWDARSGQEALTLKGHSGVVLSVVFSADGSRLACAARDRTVRVWDARWGQDTITLRADAGPVRGVGFSADGRHIVCRTRGPGGTDEVRAWDAESGAPLPPGAEPPPPADAGLLARSPDGRLAVSARGGTLVVRRLDGPRQASEESPGDGGAAGLQGTPGGPRLEGKYACSGTNPDGGKYGGITVEIRKRGDGYRLTWTGNGGSDEGEGTVVGGELVVTFKGTSGRGIVVYRIENEGRLVGTWRPKGSKSSGEEVLERK
jgi:hypothetical protein